MGLSRPSTTDNNGDESVFSPKRSEETLLATERGTDASRRLETDAQRNLYVNVAAGSLTVTPTTVAPLANGSVTGVAAGLLTTITTYTAPAAMKITRVSAGGTSYAKFQLFLNTILIETRRTGPERITDFAFESPLNMANGDILDVKVTHYSTGFASDFEATVYGG